MSTIPGWSDLDEPSQNRLKDLLRPGEEILWVKRFPENDLPSDRWETFFGCTVLFGIFVALVTMGIVLMGWKPFALVGFSLAAVFVAVGFTDHVPWPKDRSLTPGVIYLLTSRWAMRIQKYVRNGSEHVEMVPLVDQRERDVTIRLDGSGKIDFLPELRPSRIMREVSRVAFHLENVQEVDQIVADNLARTYPPLFINDRERTLAQLDRLPAYQRAWLRSLLRPGETVLWTGIPSRFYSAIRLGCLTAFLIPTVAAYLFFLFLWWKVLSGDSPRNIEAMVVLGVFTFFFGSFFALIGYVGCVPFITYFQARRGLYAVTDQRTITHNGGKTSAFCFVDATLFDNISKDLSRRRFLPVRSGEYWPRFAETWRLDSADEVRQAYEAIELVRRLRAEREAEAAAS